MKKIATLMAAMICAGSANAAVYTFDFTATVNSIYQMQSAGNQYVDSSSLSGELISIGRVIHGSFTYDTDTPRDPADIGGGGGPLASDSKSFAGAYNQNIVTADVGTPRAQVTPHAWFPNHITIYNNTSNYTDPNLVYDSFAVSESGSSSRGYEERGVSVIDETGNTLNSSDLFGPLNTSAFSSGVFWYSFMDSNMTSGVTVRAQLDSVTAVPTPVPEPTTYAMLGAGLALLAWRKKTRA